MSKDYDIFLAHSSKDKAFVRKLASDLHELKIEVWFDKWQLEPGDTLLTSLRQAIECSALMAFVVSHNSVSSDWCQKELTIALQRQHLEARQLILPIVIENVPLPQALQDVVYLDFSTNYYEQLARLCGYLHALDRRDVDLAISTFHPASVADVRLVFASANDGHDTISDQKVFQRVRRLARLAPTAEHLLDLGRVAFCLQHDIEAKKAFQAVLDADPTFPGVNQIDSIVRASAKAKRPVEIPEHTRMAMSYLGLLHDDEDLILNSAYCSNSKEVLINAGRYYLNTYNADIPCAIEYFINATKDEPINSLRLQDCDKLIHGILRDKKAMYPTMSWDYIATFVDKWNRHRWSLV